MSTNQLLDKGNVERDKLFSTCTLVHGKLFSFTSFKCIPLIGDLHTGKVILLNDLENHDPVFGADDMLSFEDNIFILELSGKRLMKFNTKERNCNYINIDCNSKDWGNFAAFAQHGKSLYIFPIYTDGFLKIDIESGRMQKKKKLYSVINECKGDKKPREEVTYFWQGCQVGSKVWLFQRSSALVVAYDMESDTWKKYDISVNFKDCIHVMSYAGSIYILSAEGKIYRWNMTNESAKEVVDCRSYNTICPVYSRIAVTDKGLFLLPALGKDIFFIDLNTKQINKYVSYPENFQYCGPEIWSKYYGYCEDDDWYYFAMRSANYILTINKRSGIEKWIKMELPSYEEYKKAYFNYNKKILFEEEWSLEDIISYTKKNFLGTQCRKYVSEGEKVWDYVKSLNKESEGLEHRGI